MFNVEYKHGETKAWVVKQAGFESSKEAEKAAYDFTDRYLNEYRVVVASTGKVIASGIKANY